MWGDSEATKSNIRPNLLDFLGQTLGLKVKPEDLFAYIAAISAHPGFIERFKNDLSTPGLRIPLTSEQALFAEAVELGRQVIWLFTFGERMINPTAGRPAQPPRLPEGRRPFIPKEGSIPNTSDQMPNTIDYDESKKRLLIGSGFIENIDPEVWNYEVSGKKVLLHWFSYRKADRSRPIIGDRRPPSPLVNVQPDHWIAEYTTELINVINVLGLLVDLEERQADILEKICAGPTITTTMLEEAGAFKIPSKMKREKKKSEKITLPFGNID